MKKKNIYLTILFFASLLTAGVMIYFFLIKSLPDISGINRLPIIESDVKVIKDKWGIPHIYADNNRDLYRVLGYLMASERLFQMDIHRRSANGELAEIFGSKAVPLDVRSKVLDLAGTAKRVLKNSINSLSSQQLEESKAFYQGINYFIDQRQLPYEFSVIGYKPKHFSIEDGFAFSGLMGLGFSAGLKKDLLFDKIKQRSPELFSLISDQDNMVPEGFMSGSALLDRELKSLLAVIDSSPVEFSGSNSWVISGNRTKSGFPILANDPHIKFSLPGIWFEAHLHSPTFEVYGHFLPIIPFPILGHNKHHAWAFTMSMVDDMDFYREKIDYNKNLIMYNGKWEPLTYRDYIIKIKGGTKRILRVPQTPHGPIISSIFGETESGNLSASWSFHNPKNLTLKSLFLMSKAQNIEEFTSALQWGRSPGLNISYADREGNIGWWVFGEIPIRPKGCASNVVNDGSDGSCDYLGYLPFKKHPHSVNPPAGYIISANSIPPAMADGIKGDWKPLDRYNSIKELILRQQKHDYKSIMKIQSSNINLTNLAVLHKMIETIETSPPKTKLKQTTLKILKQWDGKADSNSLGISIYSIWLRFLSRAIFDELTETEYKVFANTDTHYKLLKKLLDMPENPLWKSEGKPISTKKSILIKTFDQTIEYLNRRLGPITEYWSWSNLHQIEFKHPLGKIPTLKHIFNLGPYSISGGKRHINALSSSFANFSFDVVTGVSTRRVIDLASPQLSFGILPLGQSGHILSRHYNDQWPLFKEGKYRDQLLDIKLIENSSEGTLQFLPIKK